MSALAAALDRLIHKRSLRRAGTEAWAALLGLDAEDAAELATLDPHALEATARLVRRRVLGRSHRGSGSLAELYPGCIAAWRALHPEDTDLDELMACFLDSEAFDRYRELPFAGPGQSLEEAFYRFFQALPLATPAVRERAFLSAMLRALAVCPEPAFTLPREIERTRDGYCALVHGPEPWLFAAARGRFVCGALTPFLAELITLRAEPASSALGLAARHGVSLAVLRAAQCELAALGLG